MKKGLLSYIITFALILSLWPLHPLQGEEERRRLGPEERENLLGRLKDIQEGIKTFTADFTEERAIQSLPKPLIYEGTLYYHRSDFFFMRYRRPVDTIMRVEGSEVLIYVVGSGTADSADISGVKGITGHGDIFGWDPGGFKGPVHETPQGFVFKEAQQEESGGLTVLLDKKTLVAKCVTMTGENGDQTLFTFSNVKINRSIPAEIRNFSLPKGTRLNRLSPP